MPKVFLDYTQAELDRAYDQLVWAPQRDAIQAEIRKECEAVRMAMPPRTERYGKREMQVLDVFAPAGASRAPVVVYLHGGAWLRGSRLDVAYPAPALAGRGAALVVPDFDNVAEVPLPEMIEQCRAAVEWTVRHAASFGGDPDRIYLAGHSSGAHLASCVLLADPAIKGTLLISGMYDLHAPMLSARSKYVKITPEELDAASAMRHLGRIRCPVAVAWSVGDSPEFRRQGRVLSEALRGMGRLAGYLEVFSANHFEEPRQLADPDSALSHMLYGLMGI
jgi:arylformamidase